MRDPGACKWDSANLARSRLGVELAVVMGVLWAPLFAWGVIARIRPIDWTVLSLSGGLVWNAGATTLLLYLVWNRQGSLRPVGLRRTRWWAELLWAGLIFLILLASCRSIWTLFGFLGWREGSPDEVVPPSGALAVFLPVSFVASAIFEEVFVRGYLWDRLRRLTGRKVLALFLSALVFVSYHPYSAHALLVILAYGLVLGLFFLHARSLPRLVLAHAGLNIWIIYA